MMAIDFIIFYWRQNQLEGPIWETEETYVIAFSSSFFRVVGQQTHSVPYSPPLHELMNRPLLPFPLGDRLIISSEIFFYLIPITHSILSSSRQFSALLTSFQAFVEFLSFWPRPDACNPLVSSSISFLSPRLVLYLFSIAIMSHNYTRNACAWWS